MSSAEMGAPSVRPADVEGWFTGLGLTPTERADRDGITSWDLVLDGRRRFDLRITVILDPAMALICWAHYAPPISDMFRKSYRRLLRWNDEFPFASSRWPTTSARSRGRDPDPMRPTRRARDGDRPDPRHRRPASRRIEGLAVAGWPHADMGDRTSANGAFLDRYTARLPELLEAEEAGEPPDRESRQMTRSSPPSPRRPWAWLHDPPLRDPAPSPSSPRPIAGDAGRHDRGPCRDGRT
jgi:hypothetical protein